MIRNTCTRLIGQRVLKLCVRVIPHVQRGAMLAANYPTTIRQVNSKKTGEGKEDILFSCKEAALESECPCVCVSVCYQVEINLSSMLYFWVFLLLSGLVTLALRMHGYWAYEWA